MLVTDTDTDTAPCTAPYYMPSPLHVIAYSKGHDEKMLVANARLAGLFDDALKYAKMTESANAFLERTPNNGMESVDASGPGSPELILTLAKAGQFSAILGVPAPTEPTGPYQVQVPYHEASYHYARAIAFWALSTQETASMRRGSSVADGNGGGGGGSGGGGSKGTPTTENAPLSPLTHSTAPNNATLVALGDAEARLSRAAAATAIGDDGSNFTAIIPSELAAFRSWHVEQDYGSAIESFAAAVAANDANIYMEPPRWYYPTRHCLGTALLKAPTPADGQDAARALAVFATDLSSFVENPWSLYGSAAALELLGRSAEAAAFKARAVDAWHGGDGWPFVSPCPLLGGL